MRLLIASILAVMWVSLGTNSASFADDASRLAPQRSSDRLPSSVTARLGFVSVEDPPTTPTPATDGTTNVQSAPAANDRPEATSDQAVITECVELPPRESYEEISDGYPAPAQSLVPPALLSGPRFRGAGDYSGAAIFGTHIRFPYYNYRSPWTYGGPGSVNHTIHW